MIYTAFAGAPKSVAFGSWIYVYFIVVFSATSERQSMSGSDWIIV